MNRKGHQFNQIGVSTLRISRGYGQRFTLLEKNLCKVLDCAGDHQACVLQIEALRHGARKVERFSHDHFTGRTREVKCDVVSKHTLIIIRGLLFMHTDGSAQ